jgi:hypothetical protein
MKLFIQHHYTITFVPPKHQLDQKATGAASVEIEIAEVAADRAPVVMEVATPSSVERAAKGRTGRLGIEHSNTDRFTANGDGSPRRIRFHGGEFYVESLPADEFARLAGNPATVNTTYLARSKDYVSKEIVVDKKLPGNYRSYEEGVMTVSKLWTKHRGLREDKTRDDHGWSVGRQIMARAARMIIVDGVTYEHCREPIFAFTAEGDHGIVERPHSVRKVSPLGSYEYGVFKAYKYTSSLKHADELIDRLGIDREGMMFRVIDPRATKYDGVSYDIAYALAHAGRKLEGRAGSLEPSLMVEWHKLRAALEGLDMDFPAVSPAMLDAASTLSNHFGDRETAAAMSEIHSLAYFNRSHSPRHHGLDGETPFHLGLDTVSAYFDGQERYDEAKELASYATERWEMRPAGAFHEFERNNRLSSVGENRLVVSELTSEASTHMLGLQLGYSLDAIDARMGAGERMFRVRTESVPRYGEETVSTTKGVVIVKDGRAIVEWCSDGIDSAAHDIRAAVETHLEKMNDLDSDIQYDQQTISFF